MKATRRGITLAGARDWGAGQVLERGDESDGAERLLWIPDSAMPASRRARQHDLLRGSRSSRSPGTAYILVEQADEESPSSDGDSPEGGGRRELGKTAMGLQTPGATVFEWGDLDEEARLMNREKART